MNVNEMRMEREMAGVRRELAELREEVKRGGAAEEAQATRGWWELGFEVGILQQREMASIILMFAWDGVLGVAVSPVLVPGYVLHPVIGMVWGVLALLGGCCAGRVPPRLGLLEEVEEDQLVGKVPWLWRRGGGRGPWSGADVQLDGGCHAAAPAAVPAVAPTQLLKGAVEPYSSQQHSSF